MQYREALKTIDTVNALEVMGYEPKITGAYIKFECPKCQKLASIKAVGDKKNLWYCPSCKVGGNIIALYMEKMQLQYEEARDKLLQGKKKIRKLTSHLQLVYELEWKESIGLPKETCELLGIGIPKGRTMMSGATAFTVRDENGVKIAYYGIRNNQPVFHKSFSPELYLYNYHNAKNHASVVFVRDVRECAGFVSIGMPAVSNFGLPYLSEEQIELLNKLKGIDFYTKCSEIISQVCKHVSVHHRFI